MYELDGFYMINDFTEVLCSGGVPTFIADLPNRITKNVDKQPSLFKKLCVLYTSCI